MNLPAPHTLKPRKTPRQARSAVTVEAISEATIQVLLSEGLNRLTTTRVAARAGVSVGTLYQYYPHKQSLLFAVLGLHLSHVATAVEAACDAQKGQPIAAMVDALVRAFVKAKTSHIDASRALYMVAAELDTTELLLQLSKRMTAAVSSMLASCADLHFDDLPMTSFMLRSAMVGPTRGVIERGAAPRMLRALQDHLVMLCEGYLRTVGTAVQPGNATTTADSSTIAVTR
ncbi:TetR/AcrR family transcriptional regulator [soil metagenome]